MLLKLDRETVYLVDLIKHFDHTIRLDDCLMYRTYSCRLVISTRARNCWGNVELPGLIVVQCPCLVLIAREYSQQNM
jgi:hypothetical protein